jgi:predicted O-methyltransferase YrrM
LEVGTYTGYSCICLAEGIADDGVIHTIEINCELEDIVRKYIRLQGIESKVILHFGDAVNIIPAIDSEFDLVFIDGDKEQYSEYFDLAFMKLKVGGYVLVDNVLWSGKVMDNQRNHDPETSGIVNFNEKIREMQGVEKIMLPVRDGVYLIRKIV